MKKSHLLFLTILSISYLSFITALETYEFKFPEKKSVKLKIDIPSNWKISKEKKGSDLYYSNFTEKNGNEILFSLLFFKLNDHEKETIVTKSLIGTNPLLPYVYFLSNSKTKTFESGMKSWNTEDFYFHDSNIEDFSGIKIHQKNMKAYCMYDDDLFVQIHLSKLNYTAADSVEMVNILNSLKR